MKKYLPVLRNTKLFRGLEDSDTQAMLSCFQVSERKYAKGEYVIRQGDKMNKIIIVISGSLHIRRDDYWGNASIVSAVGEGEMLGEAYAAVGETSLNDVVAVKESTLLLFDISRLLTVCSSACRFHSAVIQNLFFAISEKNIALLQKMGHMSKRSTREKLISYLSQQAAENRSAEFHIPFNRQQLADYLSVDRSALSKELCRMRDEGLISFEKNRFTLIDKE